MRLYLGDKLISNLEIQTIAKESQYQQVVSSQGNADYLFARCYASDEVIYNIVKTLKDLDNITSAVQMFQLCVNLKKLPSDFSMPNLANGYAMFNECSKMEEIPEGLSFETLTNGRSMFYNCQKVKSLPMNFSTGSLDEGTSMFQNCLGLVDLVPFSISTAPVDSFFQQCISIVSVPEGVEIYECSARNFFYRCLAMKYCDAKKIQPTNCYGFFGFCGNLERVKHIDLALCEDCSGIFEGCEKLTDLNIVNIPKSIQLGLGVSYGHLLTVDSLVNAIKNLWNVYDNQTLTIGTANKTKLASTYVKIVDPTAEQRATDPYIDNKLPWCEVCESTDEGAMLIEEYAHIKYWSIT